jgi:hypothetical protein
MLLPRMSWSLERRRSIPASTIASIQHRNAPRGFAQREVKLLQSIFSGEVLSHHKENKYYQGKGMCVGLAGVYGERVGDVGRTKMVETED